MPSMSCGCPRPRELSRMIRPRGFRRPCPSVCPWRSPPGRTPWPCHLRAHPQPGWTRTFLPGLAGPRPPSLPVLWVLGLPTAQAGSHPLEGFDAAPPGPERGPCGPGPTLLPQPQFTCWSFLLLICRVDSPRPPKPQPSSPVSPDERASLETCSQLLGLRWRSPPRPPSAQQTCHRVRASPLLTPICLLAHSQLQGREQAFEFHQQFNHLST